MKFFRSLLFSLGLVMFPAISFAIVAEPVPNLEMYAGPEIGMGVLIAYALLMLLIIVSVWKIYTKAGQPGWAAIIPIYNTVVLLQMVKRPWWWLLLMLIPFVGIVWGIMALHRLSLSFGRGAGTTIGMLLLPFVFFPILAFGEAKYTPLAD